MKPADVTEADKARADEWREQSAGPGSIEDYLAAHRIAAFEAGRVAGLEDAMEACDPDWFNQEGESIREAIRALKEKNDG